MQSAISLVIFKAVCKKLFRIRLIDGACNPRAMSSKKLIIFCTVHFYQLKDSVKTLLIKADYIFWVSRLWDFFIAGSGLDRKWARTVKTKSHHAVGEPWHKCNQLIYLRSQRVIKHKRLSFCIPRSLYYVLYVCELVFRASAVRSGIELLNKSRHRTTRRLIAAPTRVST